MSSYALVAEADPVQAEQIRHLIAGEGIELELVRDGKAACEVMERRGPPALLVTALSLPRLDGFALLAELRKRAPASQSPAVVLSAFRDLRETAKHMKEELGVGSLLAKPATHDSLRRAIKRALAQNFAMRATSPGYKLPPPQAAMTNPRIDLRALEAQRQSAVKRMRLVDQVPSDADLSVLLAEAAKEFQVSAAFISLALADHHWIKAHAGLPEALLVPGAVKRDWPLCKQVVDNNEALVVPDAAAHPLFSKDPLVQSAGVRGFAAAPLAGPDGETLGALCLLDTKPLDLGPEGLDALVHLARRVAGELELRDAKANSRKDRGASAADQSLMDAPLAYLESVLNNIDAAVYLLDGQRKVAFANRVLGSWLGRDPSALLGASEEELANAWSALFDDSIGFLRRIRVPRAGPFALREQFVTQRPQRRVVRWVAKPVQLPDGIGHLGVITDITAQADLLHERETLARNDSLTGLANRRGGEEAIQREVSRSERGGVRLSFALFDVDHLKHVNDRHGHGVGDDALRLVARILLASVRGCDLVVRWGGDEFLCVLPQTGLEGARSLAERARAAIEGDLSVQGGLTISCGLAELHQGEDEGDALARADEKLFEAKAAGRNRVL